jgi:hypothetical protein
MKPTIKLLLLAALAVAPLAPALAQQSDAPPQATPVPPPSTAAPRRDDGAGEGSSLSDKLSRSHGVVRPPPTGDTGVLPPPPTGAESTPIIRPPGTPGANEQVQPK